MKPRKNVSGNVLPSDIEFQNNTENFTVMTSSAGRHFALLTYITKEDLHALQDTYENGQTLKLSSLSTAKTKKLIEDHGKSGKVRFSVELDDGGNIVMVNGKPRLCVVKKTISANNENRAAILKSSEQEAMLLSLLDKHVSSDILDNVVTQDKYGSLRNYMFIEYMNCGDGNKFVEKLNKENLNAESVVVGDLKRKFTLNLLKKMLKLHDSGIYHRDMKLENTLIRKIENDYDIFIGDFGSAALEIKNEGAHYLNYICKGTDPRFYYQEKLTSSNEKNNINDDAYNSDDEKCDDQEDNLIEKFEKERLANAHHDYWAVGLTLLQLNSATFHKYVNQTSIKDANKLRRSASGNIFEKEIAKCIEEIQNPIVKECVNFLLDRSNYKEYKKGHNENLFAKALDILVNESLIINRQAVKKIKNEFSIFARTLGSRKDKRGEMKSDDKIEMKFS